MSNTNTGGPAFPAPITKPLENYYPGISVRDYFAAKAMQALIQKSTGEDNEIFDDAEDAYRYADAMLKAREA